MFAIWLALSSWLAHVSANIAPCVVQVQPQDERPARRVNPMTMGCHSDSGYAHQARALFAELLYGAAFEKVADPPYSGAGSGAFGSLLNGWIGIGRSRLDAGDNPLIAGGTPLLLPGPGDMAINRGFAGEGLFLRRGKPYDGFLVISSHGEVVVDVALQSRSGATIATASLNFPGGNWTKLDFSLVPAADAVCDGIDSSAAQSLGIGCPLNTTYDPAATMSDRTAHTCVKCGGQFVITLRRGASVSVGYASLQPGSWGRFKGLPVHLDTVKALQSIGVTVIRQGGTFELGANMAWKNQRGPVWKRVSSVDGNWNHADVSGWGMFEIIDLAAAMDTVPIITTYYKIDPEEYADLVEYCWGNASTKWGAIRVADGHPRPYAVKHFELGNESPNPRFVDQVRAMEARAAAVGVRGQLSYILSNGAGNQSWPDVQQAKEAAALGLGDRLIWDIHLDGGGATRLADYFFANSSYDTWGAMNLETNYGDHTVQRMLNEAQDLNLHFSYANPRLRGRTASFCMERSGYNEGGLNDQGLIFFLPNMTWLQPPGHVHAMVAETWEPIARNASLSGSCGALAAPGGISAQASVDGDSIAIRIVNTEAEPRRVLFDFLKDLKPSSLTWRTITSSRLSDANTPAEPLRVSPSSLRDATGDLSATLPGQSFSVFVARMPNRRTIQV
eukprot:TRINITY_DN58111_c0_g1_i1.p1 TRINITY_DN58111_c0_g1~~TRINITY_DN58111_c0_g1_i1.p1  ORF type:complete len:673 (+),score=94.79 TRINITY_DN58111_c0_g1_i1:51-2069(+)